MPANIDDFIFFLLRALKTIYFVCVCVYVLKFYRFPQSTADITSAWIQMKKRNLYEIQCKE